MQESQSLRVNINYLNIWKIAWPVMIAGLVINAITYTDIAFLARIGKTEMNGASLGGLFYMTMVMVANGIGSGAQILIARRAGENNASEIGKIFDQSIAIFVIIAIIFMLLTYPMLDSLMHVFVNDEPTFNSALSYLENRNWALIFSFLIFAFRGFFVGIAKTRVLTVAAVLMAVSNIFLDSVLIFGTLGFPEMREAGAGMASAISETIAIAYLVIYCVFFGYRKKFGLFRIRVPKWSIFVRLINLSYPLILQLITAYGAWFIFFTFLEKVGERELAISNITRIFYMSMMIPLWGFATSANTMVSNVIGQGKDNRVLMLLMKIVKFSSIVYASLGIVAFIAAYPIALAITGNESDAMESITLMRLVITFFIVVVPTVISFNALSGTGDILAALFIELFSAVLYCTYTYYFTNINFISLEVAWSGEILYWGIIGILSWLRLYSGKWKSIKSKLEE